MRASIIGVIKLDGGLSLERDLKKKEGNRVIVVGGLGLGLSISFKK